MLCTYYNILPSNINIDEKGVLLTIIASGKIIAYKANRKGVVEHKVYFNCDRLYLIMDVDKHFHK